MNRYSYKMPNRFYKYLLILLALLPSITLAQTAHISEEEQLIATYPFSDPNPIPTLTSPVKYKIYPYHMFDGYSLKSQKQKFKVVKLENDYIQVLILPEVGGKVWGAIEKSTGKEFIYKNDVLKFRNVAWRGPWTSGGIEFNFGVVGHTPSAAKPVDYKLQQNKDGSVSCIVGNIDLPSRTQWRVEIRLPKDKAYFETKATWFNPTPLSQSYYNWMTAAAKVSDDLQFFFPGITYLGHDGGAHPWSTDENGRDLSLYKNNAFGTNKSYHITGVYTNFMGGYYHNSNFGFGHSALNDEMPGHKLWLWSLARDGAIWRDLLTDNSGQYIEFQAGRLFNQYIPTTVNSPITQVAFQSGATDSWSEMWFPVKEIGGIKKVSPKGVMNVTASTGRLEIGVNALDFVQGRLVVESAGKVIYTENHTFNPMDVFIVKVPLNEKEPYRVTLEGMDLQFNSKENDTLKRPFEAQTQDRSINSNSQLYRRALELKEYRDYKGAKITFEKCLQNDPLYIGALTGLADLAYRSAKYDSALYYVNKALRLDTYDPAANYCAGNIYRQNKDYNNAMECFGWAARSLEYRTGAYAQMAEIELNLGDPALSVHYAKQSLDYNRSNMNALQALAVAYRRSGQGELADGILKEIFQKDPLSHFADYEKYISDPSASNYSIFSSNIKNEFPYQTFIELGMTYLDLGENASAVKLLSKAPANPLVAVWEAYLKKNIPALDSAASLPESFVFPYRRETVAALEWAVSVNTSWKFKFYLALNYFAVERPDEGIHWLAECGQTPDQAIFYITRASLAAKENDQALTDLQRACKLSPLDWRTSNALIEYFEKMGEYNQAAELASKSFKIFKTYTFALQYARGLLNTGKYEQSLHVLNNTTILPFEGAAQGRTVYEQAALSNAIELIKNKKFKQAISNIEQSRKWPENLGAGQPYQLDERIQDYLSGYCYEKMNQTGDGLRYKTKLINYTWDNYRSGEFRNLLALKSLSQNGDTQKLDMLLGKLRQAPVSDADRWVLAVFTKDQQTEKSLERRFSQDMYFTIIQKVSQLK